MMRKRLFNLLKAMPAFCWLIGLQLLFFSQQLYADSKKPLPVITKAQCQASLGNKPLLWQLENLTAARKAINMRDQNLLPAYDTLIRAADKALKRGPYSVVDKTKSSPSGNPHDYVSLAPYWWPDPNKKDGLPYINRDGQVNPERNSDAFDRIRLGKFSDDVRVLSLAAYLSGDTRYAEHAQKLLKTWFLDEETRMNPSLQYAQAVPGRSEGRGIGIIDTHSLFYVVDSALLLSSNNQLTDQTLSGMRQWFGNYAKWLATHKNGLEERVAKNNHGTYYDTQFMLFSLFSYDCNAALKTIGSTRARIDRQINSKGEMPLEIDRTRSLHYHVFNLDAFMLIARMTEHFSLNLYTYKGSDGAGIITALDNLAKYAGREKSWPHPEIKMDSAQLYLWQLLRRAVTIFDNPALEQAEQKAIARTLNDEAVLIYYRPPASESVPTQENANKSDML